MDQLRPGERIGKYTIISMIGDGAQGEVYRARDSSADREVAVKVAGKALPRGVDREYFDREIRAISKLEHKSIVKYLEQGEDEDGHNRFLVMELIEGVSLRRFLERLSESRSERFDPVELLQPDRTESPRSLDVEFKSFDDVESPSAATDVSEEFDRITSNARRIAASTEYVRWCCAVVRDAAAALRHAHDRKVVHGDVKPENLVAAGDGRVRLIDFGLSRILEKADLSRSGAVMGTTQYMSPEQLTGRINVSGRSDVYSLGIVLYELLALERPFGWLIREQELLKAVTKPAPPVGARNPAISRALEGIVHKAIARDPDERYSAAAFADDLQAFLDGRRTTAKPYRYKGDDREIADSRPWKITITGLFYIPVSIIMMISSWQTRRTPDGEFDAVPFLFLFLGGAAVLFAAARLLFASNFARYFFLVFNIIVIINTSLVMLVGFPGMEPGVDYMALYLVLTACFLSAAVVPFLADSRAWFRHARNDRAERRAIARWGKR